MSIDFFCALQEGVDDLRRWRADKQANERNVWVVRDGSKVMVPPHLY